MFQASAVGLASLVALLAAGGACGSTIAPPEPLAPWGPPEAEEGLAEEDTPECELVLLHLSSTLEHRGNASKRSQQVLPSPPPPTPAAPSASAPSDPVTPVSAARSAAPAPATPAAPAGAVAAPAAAAAAADAAPASAAAEAAVPRAPALPAEAAKAESSAPMRLLEASAQRQQAAAAAAQQGADAAQLLASGRSQHEAEVLAKTQGLLEVILIVFLAVMLLGLALLVRNNWDVQSAVDEGRVMGGKAAKAAKKATHLAASQVAKMTKEQKEDLAREEKAMATSSASADASSSTAFKTGGYEEATMPPSSWPLARREQGHPCC